MPRPRETIWELEDHTAAKHRILRGYLEAWLPIMGSWCPRLVLVDGFAGPGVYAKGDPGSPIHMLNAYLQHARRSHIKAELVYAFIEQDEERCVSLKAEVAKLTLPGQVKVSFYNESFDQVFSGILDDLASRALRSLPRSPSSTPSATRALRWSSLAGSSSSNAARS